jgi:hypothetical protein
VLTANVASLVRGEFRRTGRFALPGIGGADLLVRRDFHRASARCPVLSF